MRFEFLFNPIGNSTMAFLTGQSSRVLKSGYTGRGLKQGLRGGIGFDTDYNRELLPKTELLTYLQLDGIVVRFLRDSVYNI